MSKTPLQIARCMRKLLEDPNHWTKRAYARGADGEPADPGNPGAVCWCLGGALAKCSNTVYSLQPAGRVVRDAMNARIGLSLFGGYSTWQDVPDRTHAEVIGLLDTVIQDLEADAA